MIYFWQNATFSIICEQHFKGFFSNLLLISQCTIFNVFHWHLYVKSIINSFSVGKRPIGIRDLINEALHQERMGLKAKVKQIKELLFKPETQAKIRRELFEGRSIHHSNQGNAVDFSDTLT